MNSLLVRATVTYKVPMIKKVIALHDSQQFQGCRIVVCCSWPEPV